MKSWYASKDESHKRSMKSRYTSNSEPKRMAMKLRYTSNPEPKRMAMKSRYASNPEVKKLMVNKYDHHTIVTAGVDTTVRYAIGPGRVKEEGRKYCNCYL